MGAIGDFFGIRASGWTGPINSDNEALMSRTDNKGNPLSFFKGGDGKGTKDDKGSKNAGKAAKASKEFKWL